MESAGISSQEILDQLWREGKLSDAEYERLSSAMRNTPAAPAQLALLPPPIPWQVWVAIAVCLVGALTSLQIIIKDPVSALVMIVLDLLLAYGLFRRNKWAYGITVFFCLVSIVGIGKWPVAAIINVAVGVMMLTVYSWFFPPQPDAAKGR